MTEIQLNGISYFYEITDQKRTPRHAQYPILILLHGFTGSSQNWQPLLPNLTPHFQILTLDILGHGRSASPPDSTRYQMVNIAADIVALLDKLTSQPVHLLGYSMGGRLALYLAVHYPGRFSSLILESASPGLKTEAERAERRQRDNALADRIEREGVPAFVDFWETLALWHSQKQLPSDIRTRLRQQRLQNNPLGLANSLRGMGTGVQPSLWEQLPDLQMPTLLLTGELDKKFVGIAQEIAQLSYHIDHIVIPDVGHTVHLEMPTLYMETVVSFLKSTGV